ncbi:hypothetical protein EYC87_05370 [Halieaceae bacterium IMCC8485]|uniref:Uncharacterized protein n=1 Tax=Candidatus Seongchinamella marina TaxID=2518990 RepID=A0ABT3SSP2_9GAMM|nr:hypothetical protein [Candidatus Seongchinamella marina]MCX2973014.1 hypothetical protein [Candidatus Seongchinamella marina]
MEKNKFAPSSGFIKRWCILWVLISIPCFTYGGWMHSQMIQAEQEEERLKKIALANPLYVKAIECADDARHTRRNLPDIGALGKNREHYEELKDIEELCRNGAEQFEPEYTLAKLRPGNYPDKIGAGYGLGVFALAPILLLFAFLGLVRLGRWLWRGSSS